MSSPLRGMSARPGHAGVTWAWVRSNVPVRVLVPVIVTVLGCLAAANGDQSKIGSWGLVQALPWPWFLALAALTISFFVELFWTRSRSGLVLGVHLVGLVLLLHGAPGFLEQEPRFATAWLHAGFADQILQHGTSRPEVDARFNWPGFFAAAASVAGAAGLDSPLSLVRWAPVVFMWLYLPPLYVIGRHLTSSSTSVWLGLFLFVPVNWVGQDYFAPQTLAFLLYLAVVALLIPVFRQGEQLGLGRRLTEWRSQLPFDGAPDLLLDRRLRLGIGALVLAVTLALAVSHQLTPIMLMLGTTLLVVAGRLRLLTLPVCVAVIALGWVSVGATTFWVGHMDAIVGPLGDVGETVGTVDARTTGSPVHLLITQLRVWFTLGVWSLAALSGLLLWMRGRPPVTLAALAVTPLGAIVQSYGGEGVLRIFLFSSPFACLIIGEAVTETKRHLSRGLDIRLLHGAVVAAALGCMPLFVLARYGNEVFEQVVPGDAEAAQELHRIAPPGSNLISATSQVAWRAEDAADYYYGRPEDIEGIISGDGDAVRHLVSEDRADKPTYLLVTQSQIEYAEEGGAPHDWFRRYLKPLLTPERGYQLVFHNDTAWIYRFEEVPEP